MPLPTAAISGIIETAAPVVGALGFRAEQQSFILNDVKAAEAEDRKKTLIIFGIIAAVFLGGIIALIYIR